MAESASGGDRPSQASARRARLDAVFGEVLPEQTADDADAPGDSDGAGDAWLRREVPPHHGA